MSYTGKQLFNDSLKTLNNTIVQPETGKTAIVSKINICNTDSEKSQKVSIGVVDKDSGLMRPIKSQNLPDDGTQKDTTNLGTVSNTGTVHFAKGNVKSGSPYGGNWVNTNSSRYIANGGNYSPTLDIGTMSGGNEDRKLAFVIVSLSVKKNHATSTGDNLGCRLKRDSDFNTSYAISQTLPTSYVHDDVNYHWYHWVFTFTPNIDKTHSYRRNSQYVQFYSNTSSSYPWVANTVNISTFYYDDLMWESKVYDLKDYIRYKEFKAKYKTISTSHLNTSYLSTSGYIAGARIGASISTDGGSNWTAYGKVSEVLRHKDLGNAKIKFGVLPAPMYLEYTDSSYITTSGANASIVIDNAPSASTTAFSRFDTDQFYHYIVNFALLPDYKYSKGFLVKDMTISPNDTISLETSINLTDKEKLVVTVDGENVESELSYINVNVQGVEK